MNLTTSEVEDIESIKGIPFPAGISFRKIVVTGPPGSGKTMLINKLGGWPEEGYLDLAEAHWWRSRVLAIRPREVHFGIPFSGQKESLTVFENAWLESPTSVDLSRIETPPPKRWLLSIDWYSRFVFDFQLMSAETIYTIRRERARAGTHPTDENLTLEHVQKQVDVYQTLALHFHRNGLQVYVRDAFEGPPKRIVEPDVGRTSPMMETGHHENTPPIAPSQQSEAIDHVV
jgi:hypothetical protein